MLIMAGVDLLTGEGAETRHVLRLPCSRPKPDWRREALSDPGSSPGPDTRR